MREVTGEVWLVGGDVFDGDDAVFALDLKDAIDKEKGIAMREDGHDLDDVEGLAGGGGGYHVSRRGGLGEGFGHGTSEYKSRASTGEFAARPRA